MARSLEPVSDSVSPSLSARRAFLALLWGLPQGAQGVDLVKL